VPGCRSVEHRFSAPRSLTSPRSQHQHQRAVRI
jgi:hypothetical protein